MRKCLQNGAKRTLSEITAMLRWCRRACGGLLIALATVANGAPDRADTLARVVGVVDGATLTVIDDQERTREVVLAGIAAPARGRAVAERARANLEYLVAAKRVRLRAQGDDSRKRFSARVWVQPPDCPRCGSTLDVNLAQVTAGLARWTGACARTWPAGDRGRYASAEAEARARQWGMWAPAGNSAEDDAAAEAGPGIDR